MHDAAPHRPSFPPARPFGYWYWSVFCMGFYAWLLWQFDGFRIYEREDLWRYLERLGFTMLFWSPVPMVAALFLVLPFGRTGVSVEPSRIVLTPVHGRRATIIPYEAIEKIEFRYQPKRCHFLYFGIRAGHRPSHGRSVRIFADQVDGKLVEILVAIRDTAAEGGYALTGHRLDIPHMGGEEWRLRPREATDP